MEQPKGFQLIVQIEVSHMKTYDEMNVTPGGRAFVSGQAFCAPSDQISKSWRNL